MAQKLQAFRAAMAKRYTVQSVTAALSLAHAQELAATPGEMWPMVKERQAREILAVRDGKLDIVDRRSWQWPYLPSSIARIKQPIIKLTPYNARRFANTPIPRRAINLIKNAVLSLKWDIIPTNGDQENIDDDTRERIGAAKRCFEHPNNTDSFQTFIETGIDDFCTLGAFVFEPQVTPDPKRPIKMWNVDSSTIRIYPNWKESEPDEPRYCQMTGLKGERGAIPFLDSELCYVRDNPKVDTPFGTGKMEIAFQSVQSFLGVQEMSGRAGQDQVHKTFLWWEQGQAPQNVDLVRNYLTNDVEGQSKISMIAGMKPPEVIDVQAVTVEDLLLPWQEMLIRMIANAFDLSPLALGLEKDVNRTTSEVLDDKDFHSAVVPVAVKLAEAFTRFVLHRKLKWSDLQFVFLGLDDPDLVTKMTQQSQLFAMSAETPNGVRKNLGLPPLASPFANLTQIEMIVITSEVTSRLQDQNANNQFARQQYAQERMMEMYQPQAEEGEDQGSAPSKQAAAAVTTPSLNVPKPGSLKTPKLTTPTLPKLPIAGSWFNARQIAAMSKPQLINAFAMGMVPKNVKFLTAEMENQEPGILMQLEPEVRSYLEYLKNEQSNEAAQEEVEPSPEQIARQKKLYRQSKHKPTELERNIPRTGVNDGKEVPTSNLGMRKRGR